MAAKYRNGVADAWHKEQVGLREATRVALGKARDHGMPARIRFPWRTEPTKTLRAARLRLRLRWGLRRADIGDVVSVIAADATRIRIRKEMTALGVAVARAGISQVGAPYIWADLNPIGPSGGAGSGFDCSGLIDFEHAQVGVELPHSAEDIRTDPRVVLFKDRASLMVGDSIFYDAGDRLQPGQADHIETYIGEGQSVGASSGEGRVVIRAMDANPILSFGRIEKVNGPLR